jgi:hypothetical protein
VFSRVKPVWLADVKKIFFLFTASDKKAQLSFVVVCATGKGVSRTAAQFQIMSVFFLGDF